MTQDEINNVAVDISTYIDTYYPEITSLEVLIVMVRFKLAMLNETEIGQWLHERTNAIENEDLHNRLLTQILEEHERNNKII